jgi:hypothetical protein
VLVGYPSGPFPAFLDLVMLWPKTMKWRLRSQVGDKVRWYQQPEEEQGERP